MKKIIVFLGFFLCFWPVLGENLPINERFLSALGYVESNNRSNCTGDNGKSIGIYQIHYICWRDATDFDKKIGGKYQNCQNNVKYSKKIITAYLNRYCPQAIKENNFEIMARTWNGGPIGCKKQSTIKYWIKVKAAYEKNKFN